MGGGIAIGKLEKMIFKMGNLFLDFGPHFSHPSTVPSSVLRPESRMDGPAKNRKGLPLR